MIIEYTYRPMVKSETQTNSVPLDQIMTSSFFPLEEWEVFDEEEKFEIVRAWHEQHYGDYVWVVQIEEHLD
jgi:hypothetical protein